MNELYDGQRVLSVTHKLTNTTEFEFFGTLYEFDGLPCEYKIDVVYIISHIEGTAIYERIKSPPNELLELGQRIAVEKY